MSLIASTSLDEEFSGTVRPMSSTPMRPPDQLPPHSRTRLLSDVPVFLGLLVIVVMTCLGIGLESTPLLTACFFIAVGGIVAAKGLSGQTILRDSRNFVYGGVLFWILLDPLQSRNGVEDFSEEVIAETLLYVAVFLATVSLGYLLPPSRRLAAAFGSITEPRDARGGFRAAACLYFLGVVPILYYSRGSFKTFLEIVLAGYNWDMTQGWRRGAMGSGADYVFTILFLILNAVPFLALWLLARGRIGRLQRAALVWIVLSVPTFYFFSGSRRLFGFLILGPLLYTYEALPAGKRKFRGTVALVVIPVCLLLAMQAQVQFRVRGFYDLNLAELETRLDHLHRDNIFFWMLTAVSVMPEIYPFTGEMPFRELLIHPIPRFLWQNKPVNEGFPFQSWVDFGATLTISVVGQFYIALGAVGVIVAGLSFGWTARNWDQLVRDTPRGSIRSSIYYMGSVLFFVIGIRNFGEIVTQWYSVGFLILIAYLLGHRNRPTVRFCVDGDTSSGG